jgi:hypothetical protein
MPAGRWKKVAGITVLVIITLVVLGVTFTVGWRPFIGARKRTLTDRKFEQLHKDSRVANIWSTVSPDVLVVTQTRIGQSRGRRPSPGKKGRVMSGRIRTCPG